MIVSLSNPIIAYSEKGVDFKYERLFLQLMKQYIFDFKNADYEKLTDKDKSIALARIIKAMVINGIPATEFFREQIDQWSDKENFEKNRLVIDLMAREIFGCYDKNRFTADGDFYKSPYIFAIMVPSGFDYFEPEKPAGMKNKLGKMFGKKDLSEEYYSYYNHMKKLLEKGRLPKSPVFFED
jgi:hypothetical protein